MERIILTAGGTGGHIFPALALAEELRRRNPGVMLLFMGGLHGPEADMAAKAGLDFVGLPVRGVLGRGVRGILAIFGMSRGLVRAYGVIRRVKPELVVGFGGYAAFAGVLAARMAGAATAIHEQNFYPGMANRLLGGIVDRVFLSMPDASGIFAGSKTVLVGNPVRAAITGLHEKHPDKQADDLPGEPDVNEEERKKRARSGRDPRLLVMGGSLGARAINRTMPIIIGELLEAGVEIWHQTGPAEHESVRAAYRRTGAAERIRVEPFISDMRRAYGWADLVLCRAGGSSLAEITAAGLPALLVPLPWAAQDHQRHNAAFLEQAGGAVVLEQACFYREHAPLADSSRGEDGPGLLARKLLSLLGDRTALEAMGRKSLAVGRPYAAASLADGLEDLIIR